MQFWGNFQAQREITRFAVVGLITNLIDYGVFGLLYELIGVKLLGAQLAAYVIAALFSFLANRRVTFQQSGRDSAVRHLSGFIAVNIVGLMMSAVLVAWLAPMITAWFAKLATSALLFVWFFVMSRHVIYKPRASLSVSV